MAVKISALTAIDVLAVADVLPVVDASASTTKKVTGQQVLDLVQSTSLVDSTFRILGSSDATKKLAFEVDGVTTATTRTATMPDRNITLSEITLATPQASTSGTSIDFTSIPTGIKRITIMLNEVSTNGTSRLRLQLGDAGGIETTGYAGSTGSDAGPAVWTASTGVDLNFSSIAAGLYTGVVTITLLNSSTNVWAVAGMLARTDTAALTYTTGRKALSAVLDRVRITTENGTDTFDAGEINITFE